MRKFWLCAVAVMSAAGVSAAAVEGKAESNVYQDGEFVEYFDDGIHEVTNYKSGLRHGVRKQYERGRLKKEWTYVNGKLEGPFKVYNFNGSVDEEVMFKDGVKHGVQKLYTDEGKQVRVITYANGERDGVEKGYYHIGGIGGTYEFTAKRGEKDGVEKKYRPDGSLETIKHWPEGTIEFFNEQGRPVNEEESRQIELKYHSNGVLESRTNHKTNEAAGYYTTGDLWWTRKWNKDKSEYQIVYWDEKITREEQYKNDKLVWERKYDEGGHLKTEDFSDFENSTKVIKVYSKDGKVSKQMEYKDGKRVKTTLFDKSGKVIGEENK